VPEVSGIDPDRAGTLHEAKPWSRSGSVPDADSKLVSWGRRQAPPGTITAFGKGALAMPGTSGWHIAGARVEPVPVRPRGCCAGRT